jgi:ABC-type oligopeptide transport system ATPase subunit
MTLQPPLLDVQDFSLEFRTRSGTVQALQHVNLRVGKGEIVGLVGESGSGKSVLSYAMLGISDAAAKVTGGSAMFGGIDLLQADEATLLELRGREISMIFQSPRTALNPIRRSASRSRTCCGAMPWPRAAAPGPTRRWACASAPSRRCATWPSPTPSGAGTPIRSSSPAACASG